MLCHVLWSAVLGGFMLAGSAVAHAERGASGGPRPTKSGEPGRDNTIAGTVWMGRENLHGYNTLTFHLHVDGKATMIDSKGTTTGIWVQDGPHVTIRFRDCVYRGQLDDTRLAGTALFIAGAQAGKAWDFQVSRYRA